MSYAVLKGLGILIKVFIVLLTVRSYDVIIIQNPPCLPAVLAASFVSLFNGSTVVIDWHNLGFAMFEERLGKQHLLVRLAFQLERSICRLAHHHICVSRALKEWLAEHFCIQATVLYDRPAGLFVKEDPTVGQRHSLFVKLGYRDEVLFPTLIKSNVGVMADESDLLYRSTCQTSTMSSDSLGEDQTIENINVNIRIDRAKMVVSATSWTADEDFSILLDALQGLDQFLQSTNDIGVMREDKREQSVPSRVLVVVTGKGPLKAEFEAAVVDLNARGLLRYVAIKTAWLSADDYSLLLRCADLGICLHTSTSGLDLPMKVT